MRFSYSKRSQPRLWLHANFALQRSGAPPLASKECKHVSRSGPQTVAMALVVVVVVRTIHGCAAAAAVGGLLHQAGLVWAR